MEYGVLTTLETREVSAVVIRASSMCYSLQVAHIADIANVVNEVVTVQDIVEAFERDYMMTEPLLAFKY